MIEIRETRLEDLSNIQKLWADGDVMQFVGFPEGLHRSKEEMENWFQKLVSHRPRKNHYVIFEDGLFCGETFYYVKEENRNCADLDIKLFSFARGRGLATKALSYVIKQAFCHGAEAVCVTPNVRNLKAIALYTRLGFENRDMPEAFKQAGSEGAYLYMEMKREVNDVLALDEIHFLELQQEEIEEIEGALDAYDRRHMSFSPEGRISIGIKEHGKLVAGLDGCMTAFRIFYLSTLFVDEEYRRKGYGKALIQEMEKRAKALGADTIRLDTFDFQGKEFYEKVGYTCVGRYCHVEGDYEESFFLKRI